MAWLFCHTAIRTPQCRATAEGQGRSLHHSTEWLRKDSEKQHLAQQHWAWRKTFWEPHLDLCFCILTLWPLPTVGCSLQLNGQLCTHQLAMSSVARGETGQHTKLWHHQGVTSHSRQTDQLKRSVVYKAGRRHTSADLQPTKQLFVWIAGPGRVVSAVSARVEPPWPAPLYFSLKQQPYSPSLPSTPSLQSTETSPYSAQGPHHPSRWRMLPNSKDIAVIIFALAYCSVHSGLCGPHPRLV